jgi:hypothetical protein
VFKSSGLQSTSSPSSPSSLFTARYPQWSIAESRSYGPIETFRIPATTRGGVKNRSRSLIELKLDRSEICIGGETGRKLSTSISSTSSAIANWIEANLPWYGTLIRHVPTLDAILFCFITWHEARGCSIAIRPQWTTEGDCQILCDYNESYPLASSDPSSL